MSKCQDIILSAENLMAAGGSEIFPAAPEVFRINALKAKSVKEPTLCFHDNLLRSRCHKDPFNPIPR